MPPLFGSLEKGSGHLPRLATLGVILAICFALPVQLRRDLGPVFWWDAVDFSRDFQLMPAWLAIGGILLFLVALIPLPAVVRAIGLLVIGGVPIATGQLEGALSTPGGPTETFGLLSLIGFLVLTIGAFLRRVADNRAGLTAVVVAAGAGAVLWVYLFPTARPYGDQTMLITELGESFVESFEHMNRRGGWLISIFLALTMLPMLHAVLALFSLFPGSSAGRLAGVVGYLQLFYLPLYFALMITGMFVNGGSHSLYMPWPSMLQFAYAFFLYLYLVSQGSMELYRLARKGASSSGHRIREPEPPAQIDRDDDEPRTVASDESIEQRLARLAELRRKDLISEEEADEQRAKILRDL